MRLTVLAFAHAREALGAPRAVLDDLPDALTVESLLAALEARHPELRALPLRVAVNRRYAAAEQAIRQGDEVALLPPVSGG
jgi:molybdopterin synthase catalytic subunit